MEVVFDVYFGYNKKNIDSVAGVSASYFSKTHINFSMIPTDCFTLYTELASDTLSLKCEQGWICWRTWEGRSCIKTPISALSEFHTRWMHLCSPVFCTALQHFNVTWDTGSQTNTSFSFASLPCVYAVGKIN